MSKVTDQFVHTHTHRVTLKWTELLKTETESKKHTLSTQYYKFHIFVFTTKALKFLSSVPLFILRSSEDYAIECFFFVLLLFWCMNVLFIQG